MARLRVVHWNRAEAAPLLAKLREGGFQVDYEERPDYHLAQAIRAEQPAAVLIDLSRLPSHGREIGVHLRGVKSTRHVPIVFVNGDPEKVEATRQKLPDAAYTTTARVLSALRRAIAEAPAAPVVPPQMMERYAGRTAAQKLGIKEGHRIAVVDPPRDYAKVIGPLPDGASLDESAEAGSHVTLWFVRDPAVFHASLAAIRERAANTKLWILWQKQSARGAGGINENAIRDAAIAVGLVDYKVCAVNQTWSGLALAPRKSG
jgi:CheY-like chemotaxis protein